MPARINNPAFVVPGAMDALQAMGAAVGNGGVPETTINLVLMRTSQVNGCGVCLEGHTRRARNEGETDERLTTSDSRRSRGGARRRISPTPNGPRSH